MPTKSLVAAAVLLVCTGVTAADEFDAVITDATRSFTKRKNAPEQIHYGRITLDSKGKLVSMIIKEGQVTKETKVALGTFDEKKKVWMAGEAISDGVGADLFREKGNTIRVRLKLADDNATIQQILVTNTNEKLEKADKEFDAIFKGHGNTNFGGQVAFAYQRIELDEQGKLVNKFAVTSTSVSPDTKFVTGTYNKKESRWEAGEEVTGGVWNEMFKDHRAKTIYLRITKRDDDRGIAQVLVCPFGEPGKK